MENCWNPLPKSHFPQTSESSSIFSINFSDFTLKNMFHFQNIFQIHSKIGQEVQIFLTYLLLIFLFFYPIFVYAKSLQLCPTLWDPMDCNLPGSSVHGILQARILEWVAISFSRGSSQPRDRTCIPYISCIGKQVLYHQCHPGSPYPMFSPLINSVVAVYFFSLSPCILYLTL